MDLENTGKNWEDEAPLLAGMKVKNPFTVPENYFAELGTQVNSLRIVEDARFNNEDEFTVPENYFEGLISEIEIRVAEQNIQKIASTDGFSVQINYFSNLPQIITEQINTNNQPPKAVVKQISANFLKYAAAACVTLVLGSVIVFNNQNKTLDSKMDKLSDQEIVNYLQMNSDIGDTPLIIESLSLNSNMALGDSFTEAELEKYIDTTL